MGMIASVCPRESCRAGCSSTALGAAARETHSMPTYRARLIRFLIRYSIGRKLRKAGLSEADWRKLDHLMVRSQRLPRGTKVSPVTMEDLPAEWVQAPDARPDAAILYLHGGGFVMGSPATHRLRSPACPSGLQDRPGSRQRRRQGHLRSPDNDRRAPCCRLPG